MTNLVEILKNAPKGLGLYSPVYGKVKLETINERLHDVYKIAVTVINDKMGWGTLWFDECGRIDPEGECCLFPSSEHKSWNEWQKVLFKPGYFITYIGMNTLITVEVPKEGFPKEDDYLKSRFATTKEIEIWYKYHPKSSICYVQDTPFTIDDFKPFDKVLVRAAFGWKIEFFAVYHKGWDTPYECLEGSYDKCVPYNDETKHLLGTFEEYNGKYKTW
jgi:hypothetical protein